MKTLTTCLALALAAALTLPAASFAAPPTGVDVSFTGQPTSWTVRMTPYSVDGYGDARFGMRVDEVRTLLARDHAASIAGLKDEVEPATHRRTLTLEVPHLAPGPGRATLNYVFNAGDQRLVAVNIYWIAPGLATAAQRLALIDAAKVVTSDLVGYTWPRFSSWRAQVQPRGDLIVFSGRDVQGGGVEVRLDGVDLDIQPRRKNATSAISPLEHRVAPPGPARLRLAFVASNSGTADARIPAGAF